MSEKSKRFSFEKAAKLDSDDRKARQPVEALLDILPLKQGARVMDLGAGTGYYAIPIAKEIARKGSGKLVAVDVEPKMLEILTERAVEAGLGDVVTTVVSKEEDGARLPLEDGIFDLVIVVNLLHELDDMSLYLKDIYRVLKAGGHLVAVDWAPVDDPPWGPPADHRLPLEDILDCLEDAGFEDTKVEDVYEGFNTLMTTKMMSEGR